MNTIEYKNEKWLEYFRVNKNVIIQIFNENIGYTPKCGNPIKKYFAFISPDYNPCGNYKIESRTIRGLTDKINGIDYRIVKPVIA
jgi:hypothetical protein